ncbi:uncharacterized protein AB675_7707 [Cyphellophora attinorum]|uniref:Uncharacterized protein n=1 Tax=Cyphellophora attinorum TaxID=1664694 RepID=A0A0N0NMM8_9EURO|nr:uncharacterized protein AB675_7707 [Phialophora attinorum]KPI40389.1 hypothetical protein AB675_7707 [Phialophora attinorum]
MCVTSEEYYLHCGHAIHNHKPCLTSAKYDAQLSNNFCKRTYRSTDFKITLCDRCNVLLGHEVLPTLDPASPLVWMNNVYRASLIMKPEPRDQAVDDSWEMVVLNDARQKVEKKRSPSRGEHVPLDRKCKVVLHEMKLARLLPSDIQKDL